VFAGSIPIEIPILWPHAVMVNPSSHAILMPLVATTTTSAE